jgi:hypothetical protein
MPKFARTLTGPLAAALGLLVVTGCGPSTGGEDPDAGSTCNASEAAHCEGPTWLTCVDGKWQGELCPQPNICVQNLGCRVCKPNDGYCSSQDAYVCNADGTAWDLVETCAAEQQCVEGGCLSACEQAQTSRSNVGCEFWAVDLPSDYQCQTINGGPCDGFTYGCAACQQFAVVIANTSDFTVSIKVEQNNAPPGQPLDLSVVEETQAGPKGLQVLNLPQREVDCTGYYVDAQNRIRRDRESTTCLSSKAYRVTTTYPVVAYQFNPIINAYSNGASLLIPTNALDMSYYVMGWYTSNPMSLPMPNVKIEGIPDFMYVTVVAVMDNTNVQILSKQATQAGDTDAGMPVEAVEIGGTISASLGQFDVLAVASRAPKSIAEAGKQGGDFTGTLVTADKPIVVFSSGQRSMAPDDPDGYSPAAPRPADYDLCCTEHFEQQMFPISSLGKQFVVTRTPPRQRGSTPSAWEPDFYRVLATKPNTVVTTNLPDFPSMTIAQPGEYAKLWSQQDFILESNEPIMIAQFAVAEQYLVDYEVGGDPEFILFPPAEQHRQEYVFLTPQTFEKDFVVVAAPEGTEVLLDGVDVNVEFGQCDRYLAGTLNSMTYNAIRCPVQDGPHTVLATEPVGISVYGYYSVGSYGYPGGADVRLINIQ